MTATADSSVPLVEMRGIGKTYGHISALTGISLRIHAGEVTGILGDNGAGKSTLIKIMAGLHQPTEGDLLVDGEPTNFTTPADALAKGIATVYQNLAVVPLMPVWRNFFLGQELRGRGFPFRLDANAMRATTLAELEKMGIELPDVDAPIGSLSGGQRQCVAIARAVYFGARVLILDEPTAALGVKQSGVVLKYITAAKEAGFGVVFITHNPHHAHLVGNHFVLLKRGRQKLDCTRDEITLAHLTQEMAGGDELDAISQEIALGRRPSS
ncbi:MAG: ATP-binding cassette domain-containing protein [Mycobacterium sp.]